MGVDRSPGVENSSLVRLRFGGPGDTHPPRISRSIYNLNSRVVLFSDLLMLSVTLPRTNLHSFYQRSPQSVVRIHSIHKGNTISPLGINRRDEAHWYTIPRSLLIPITIHCFYCHIFKFLFSLRKHPVLLALRRWGRLAPTFSFTLIFLLAPEDDLFSKRNIGLFV